MAPQTPTTRTAPTSLTTPAPDRSAVLSRRRLLLAGSLTAGAGSPILSSCSDPTKDTNTGERNAAATLPTYAAVNLIEPDLPGDQILMPGYYRYPRDPKPVFAEPPAGGLGEISLMYTTFVPVPQGADKNAFYAQLEEKIGVRSSRSASPRHRTTRPSSPPWSPAETCPRS